VRLAAAISMTTLDQLQPGDWLTGSEGTHWKVRNPAVRNGYVRLEAIDAAELEITTDQFAKRLAAGEFEPATVPEGQR
jgi:hypothetical protein